MCKIQKISGLEPTISFSEFDFYSLYGKSFPSSELGGIHRSIPWVELVKTLGLKESKKGRKGYFSPQGKLGLMFLKSYSGLSDSMLVNQLNTNIHYQLFCGIRIHPLYPLTNIKIISQIRCELSSRLNIERFQEVLATYWKPYLEDLSVLMTDATCYESYIRYPTDIKLLWESVDWMYSQMCKLYKASGLRKPRSKYEKQRDRYRTYSKMRKPGKSRRQVLKRSLIHLLGKLIGLTEQLLSSHQHQVVTNNLFKKRYEVIRKIYYQQKSHFQGKEIKNRIVSIDKPYIRPIVRGKETKRVEFGAKVNTIQANGINFIEHISFDAFNEGIRLTNCIHKQQRLFHHRVRQVAADSIYANNRNRSYCRNRKIVTSFVRKGRAGKDEQQTSLLRSILSKERSTRLEGSFGTEKNHYGLQKIKARTEKTEILWIFFGIQTANAVRMIPKMEKTELTLHDSA